MKNKLYILLLLVLTVAPLKADNQKYDGLKLVVSGDTLFDKQSDSTMTLHGFSGKYDQDLVGIYISQHGQDVHFYMDAEVWARLKADLLRARDEWQTISPTQFLLTGEVQGYRVGTALSTMRISLEGENELDNKRLAFSLNGGGNTPRRVFASINYDQIKSLADQFQRVDEALGED